MQNKSPQGFSIIEALITVLVIAALGFGGWYAWHKHNRPAKQSGNTASENGGKQTNPSPRPSDPYEGWMPYCDTTYGYCFKYPTDWAVSVQHAPQQPCDAGQVTLTSPSQTVSLSYENDNNHDGAAGAITPISIDTLTSANQNLTVVGSYANAGTTYFSSYALTDSSALTSYPLTVGTATQFPQPMKFTDQGTDTMQCSGSLLAQPSQPVHSLAEAKAWFHTPDAKTSLQILKSLYRK